MENRNAPDGFIQVQGREFVRNGHPIRLRGFGIGSWLNLEHFMLGLPGLDCQIRAAFADVYGVENSRHFFSKFTRSFVDQADFAYLKSLGVNFLRVPFNHRLFLDEQRWGHIRPEGFEVFDRLLGLCAEYGIFLMPDLHTTPGGQNPDWHAESHDGQASFWRHDAFRKQAVSLWAAFAERYRDHPWLMGYDLLNEPFLLEEERPLLHAFQREATEAIRRVDPHHIILLEGDHFAMDYEGMSPPVDPQTAIAFHYYPTVWEEGLLNRDLPEEQRRKAFREGVASFEAVRERLGCPVLCGEAGYELNLLDIPFGMQLLKDTIDAFEEAKISWTIWSYKDAGFMGLVQPSLETPWMRFTSAVREKWTHHGEARMAMAMVRETADRHFGGISDELAYRLQFRARNLLQAMQMEKILLPMLREIPWEQATALPKSFALANCRRLPEYESLIREYTSRGC